VDWKKLLTELLAEGMTQKAIADEIGLTQGAISQVLNDTTGKRRGFNYEAGSKLIELHRGRIPESKQSAAA